MTPARFRWGVWLIAIGIMLLLSNAGEVSWDYWWDLFCWWPILLIAIGVEKIFLHSRLHVLSYLSSVILVGTMALVAINSHADQGEGDFFSAYRWSEDADPNIKLIIARIDHDCNDLFVRQGSSDLIYGRFDRFSRRPSIAFSKEGEVGKLEIERRSGGMQSFVVINDRSYGRDWTVSFAEDVPLELKCYGDDADVTLHVDDLPLKSLFVSNDDGDIFIKCGTRLPEVNIKIAGEEAGLRLKVPEQCGLRVMGDAYQNYLEELGFIADGDNFQTDGFDTASVKIILEPDSDLRRFYIDYY
ncbi:MAG: hypothetical protein JW763_08450 [candidate division Zixibacteria bacterium]|nr:hypothetical protein [candidate division Zixibacteria bacterium]